MNRHCNQKTNNIIPPEVFWFCCQEQFGEFCLPTFVYLFIFCWFGWLGCCGFFNGYVDYVTKLFLSVLMQCMVKSLHSVCVVFLFKWQALKSDFLSGSSKQSFTLKVSNYSLLLQLQWPPVCPLVAINWIFIDAIYCQL